MTMDWAVEKNFPEATGNVKEVAQAVLDGYRSGNPVLVFDDKGKLLHGREHVEAGVSMKMDLTAMVINTPLSRQEWDDSNLTEWCEAARTLFMADQFPQQEE